ncbi:MAG: DUF1737 domain-containing protein [Pseudomonadota bacterium]
MSDTPNEQKPYIVLCEPELSALEDAVSELIAQGYRPHGDMTIQPEREELYFYQPMVLKAIIG